MAIEFRCAQCGKLLRTADETAGRPAQCPQCGALTPIPARHEAPADLDNPYLAPTEYGRPEQYVAGPPAASRVMPPAVALIVIGALMAVLQLFGVAGNLLQIAMGAGAAGNAEDLIPMFLGGGIGLAVNAVGLVVAAVVVFGAVKMISLQSYGFALAAAIGALLPTSCCCFFGVPFGIWALVVLCDPAVKAAFRG